MHSSFIVQLPTNYLLYLNRTALSADTPQRWIPLSGKVRDLGSSPLPAIPASNCDCLQKAVGPSH